jgi:hypothetical protein
MKVAARNDFWDTSSYLWKDKMGQESRIGNFTKERLESISYFLLNKRSRSKDPDVDKWYRVFQKEISNRTLFN